MRFLKEYVGIRQTLAGQMDVEATHPEIELLRCCARTMLDEETTEQVQKLLRQPIDWSYLVRLAVHHRIIPLIYRSLGQNSSGAVPAGVLLKLKNYSQTNIKRNLFLTKELIKLIDLLESHRILSIPYKGPALAILAYGNIGIRQFGDLDILVRPRDYFKARNLLLASGYRLETDWGWECSLVNDTLGVYIDLHRAITPEIFPVRLDFERLLERIEPVSIASTKFNTLCAEDMLVVLCIQLAKDAWGESPLRLSKVCDIAELLRACASINWDRVFNEAKRLGGQRMLLLGLSVAHDLLGAPVPKSLNGFQSEPHLSTLAAHTGQRLFHEAGGSRPMHCSMASFHFKLRERWLDKLYPYYHDFKLHMIPTEEDRALVSLPKSLSFLYHVIRPIRLVKKHGLNLLKMVKTKYLSRHDQR